MIPAQQAHIHTTAQTHPGSSGKNNEDRFAVTAFHTPDDEHTPTVFAVVADGIGGHLAGEVAADVAVDRLTQFVAESDGRDPVSIITQGIIVANQAVHEEAKKDQMRQGMGSTCACAWLFDDRLFIGSVGDSRIYLHRGRDIYQLTKDHTWIQDALDNGIITPEQALDHPRAHIIRRFLGSPNHIRPDLGFYGSPPDASDDLVFEQGMPLKPGDQVILCSDGLTDLVANPEIREILRTKSPEKAVQQLIDLANRRGGHDNITIVVLTIPVNDNPQVSPPRKNARSNGLACFGLVGLSSLIVLAVLLAWYFIGPLFGFPPFPLLGSTNPTPTPTPDSPLIAPTQPQIQPVEPTLDVTPAEDTTTPTVVPTTASPTSLEPTPTYTPWPTNTLEPGSG